MGTVSLDVCVGLVQQIKSVGIADNSMRAKKS